MTDDITHRYAKHLVFLAAKSKIIVIITAGFFTIEAEAVDIETTHPGCFPGQQILLNLFGQVHFFLQSQAALQSPACNVQHVKIVLVGFNLKIECRENGLGAVLTFGK